MPNSGQDNRENPRFWAVVNAWAVGQLTAREFVREQRRILGFVWITPEGLDA